MSIDLSRSYRSLRKRAILSSAIFVAVSVGIFGAIEFFGNVIIGWNKTYNPILMLGMIPPMGIIFAAVSYASLRKSTEYTTDIIEAISAVAAGNFAIRLGESQRGLYSEVYADFNKMCRELESVQTLRDDFIRNLSHEFKTPISSINGFAQAIMEAGASRDEVSAYAKIIYDESLRLEDMSTRALIMAKLDTQEFIIDKARYSLDEQLRRCVIILSPQWSKKGIDVSADLESADFEGNEALLHEVWLNILSNAIKFTPDGGAVSVSLARKGESLAVDIADDGKGMGREELVHAFDKYFQGETTSHTRGLGLGLAIAKRIVELSGGTISARSEPNEGSVFSVSLPCPR